MVCGEGEVRKERKKQEEEDLRERMPRSTRSEQQSDFEADSESETGRDKKEKKKGFFARRREKAEQKKRAKLSAETIEREAASATGGADAVPPREKKKKSKLLALLHLKREKKRKKIIDEGGDADNMSEVSDITDPTRWNLPPWEGSLSIPEPTHSPHMPSTAPVPASTETSLLAVCNNPNTETGLPS